MSTEQTLPSSYDRMVTTCQELQQELKTIGTETDWEVDEKHGFWLGAVYPLDIDTGRDFTEQEKTLITEFLAKRNEEPIWPREGGFTSVTLSGDECD